MGGDATQSPPSYKHAAVLHTLSQPPSEIHPGGQSGAHGGGDGGDATQSPPSCPHNTVLHTLSQPPSEIHPGGQFGAHGGDGGGGDAAPPNRRRSLTMVAGGGVGCMAASTISNASANTSIHELFAAHILPSVEFPSSCITSAPEPYPLAAGGSSAVTVPLSPSKSESRAAWCGGA